MRMAQIERSQGKLAEAVTHLREAVASEPANADAHVELGRALAINPKHVDALYNLGAIHANSGDTVGARSDWERAIASAPESDSGKKARDGLARLPGGENRRSK
jgi:Flp pilus assembly protein TadD